MKNNSHKLFTRRHFDWFADLINSMYKEEFDAEPEKMIRAFAGILIEQFRTHSNFNEDQFRERMNRK